MPRWDADAGGRLLYAAMELFLERGYEHVTTADIAEHAGLTKRSFFRHYTDKREVLFGGADTFQHAVVEAVSAAPASWSPARAAAAALTEAGTALTAWGEPVRQRQRVVDSAVELRERELTKYRDLATAIAAALQDRGVDELTATIAAHTAVTAFTIAFRRWTDATDERDFAPLMQDTVTRQAAAVAARRRSTATAAEG